MNWKETYTKIFLKNGDELTDGISNWWSACHGLQPKEIITAIKSQADELAHIMFAGVKHSPAEKLAENLINFTPKELNHVFFADSGSCSVEIALKIAIQYWLNKGVKGKDKFVSFKISF